VRLGEASGLGGPARRVDVVLQTAKPQDFYAAAK
jgi:hypothetical protein